MSQSRELVATASFSAAKRKVTAVKACAERDITALAGLLNAYISARGKKGARTSPATRKAYETGLLRWVAYCWPNPDMPPKVNLLRATRDDIEGFLAALSDEGKREATVQSYLAALKAFYRALEWTEAIEKSPAEQVLAPSDPRPAWERRSPVAYDDYKRLLAACRNKGPIGVRDAALLRLLGDCGLRVGEVVALNVGDLDLERELLTVQRGKGGKKRTLPLTKSALLALKVWLTRRRGVVAQGERAVIVNVGRYCRADAKGKRMGADGVRGVLNRLYLAAGLPPDTKGAHVLRHTAATRLYEKTEDINKVARFLGHSNINTSAIYAHFSIDTLRDDVRKMDDDD